jgi:hypothetical protein
LGSIYEGSWDHLEVGGKKKEFVSWFAHTLFSIQLLIVMSNTLSHCNNAKSEIISA